MDTQANGVTVSSENVYLNPATGSSAILPKPLRNLQYSKRFRILDSAYVPPGGAYAGTDGASTLSISNQVAPCVQLSWKGNITCDCSGTTANVSAVTDNAFHIIAFAASTARTPVFAGKCRVRFVG